MSAAAKRSWQPAARMVVWQLRGARPAAASPEAAVRGLATGTAAGLGAGSGGGPRWLVRVSAVQSGGTRPAVAMWGGGGLRDIGPPHARFAGATAKVEEPEEQPDIKPLRSPEKSNYWGVTTDKTFTREDGEKWPWNCFRPSETYEPDYNVDITRHRAPTTFIEKTALWGVRAIKVPTIVFFQKRYGCRAMMLETVAAVPGMVGGMLLHLRSLRRFEHSGGWIKALLDEAENERMHLMTLMDVVQPAWYERWLVVAVQGIFFNAYFILYLISPRLAHRITGYLEEEAIASYTIFLNEIDAGTVENVPAPPIAIDYWRLPKDARLRDVILALRADEAHHRDVNHYAADISEGGKQLNQSPAPVDYH